MVKGFNNYIKKRTKDEDFIFEALIAADHGKGRGDIPIGALLILPTKSLCECNTVWSEQDMTNHAEINVIRKASQMGFRKLNDAVLYCTIEPCIMCAAAAIEYGIKEVVFGAYDSIHGFSSSNIFNKENIPFSFRGGILAKECIEILPSHIQIQMRESIDESI